MKAITTSELEKIEKSSNPEIAIHVFIFNKFKECGYAKTQVWIRQTLKSFESNDYPHVKQYLDNRVNKNEQFEPHKDGLLNLTLELYADKLEAWVYNMTRKDFSKESIFEILSELFIFVQFNPKTGNTDSYYDLIADLLDKFTYLGKGFRILPNEPDCA